MIRRFHARLAGGPLYRESITRVSLVTLNETTGGAPLLAPFEKWPAKQPTPFDSVLRDRSSDLHLKHFPLIHHVQPVTTITDIPLAMPENEIRLVTAKLRPSPKTDFDAHEQGQYRRSLTTKMTTLRWLNRLKIQPKTA